MALPNYRVAKGLPDGSEKVAYVAGTTIVRGNLVKLSLDGQIDPVTAATAVALGVALNAATVGEEVIVATLKPGVVLSAVNKTGGSYTAALVGDATQTDTDGMDVGTADANGLIIQGIDPTDDPGTGATRVLVSAAPARSQAPGGGAAPT